MPPVSFSPPASRHPRFGGLILYANHRGRRGTRIDMSAYDEPGTVYFNDRKLKTQDSKVIALEQQMAALREQCLQALQAAGVLHTPPYSVFEVETRGEIFDRFDAPLEPLVKKPLAEILEDLDIPDAEKALLRQALSAPTRVYRSIHDAADIMEIDFRKD